jgi:hypothetical protein
MEFDSKKFVDKDYDMVNNQCLLNSIETFNYSIDENNNLIFDGLSNKIFSLTNNELSIQTDLYDYDKDGIKDNVLTYLTKN